MISKPRISILIPTYKRGHLLSYVLKGLRNQTYKDFEVIIVLKPSGDNTEQIVKKYKRWLNIKLILQKQGYVTGALNLGLEHAEGDIIAFLDDDAIPHPDWLQNHVKIYTESSVGGVAGNVISIVEAMAMGCIPIVHNSGGVKEYVPTDYRYENIHDAAQKIEKTIHEWSPSKAQQMIKIAERFNEENFSKGFMKLFKQYEENTF